MARSKVAVILTWNGFQDQEVIYPYYRLDEEGFTVHVTTNCDGGCDADRKVVGLFGTKFPVTWDVRNIKPDDFNLLVLPGGVKALEKLRQCEEAINLIRRYHAYGGVIASICHGAQLLISAQVVKGREVSGYYSIRDDITNAGGIFVDAPAVVSENIISSPHYKYMGPWMRQVLEQFYYYNELNDF